MTTRQFLQLVRRRWYLALVGVVALAMIPSLTQRPPVYWSRTTLVVISPQSQYAPNVLENLGSATSAAGLIVTAYNGRTNQIIPSSPDTPLYGMGVREGQLVVLRNIGGQWTVQSPDPNIDIQVVGSAPDEVLQRIIGIRRALVAELDEWQNRFGVTSQERMRIEQAPGSVGVIEVPNSRTRALLVALLLGLVGTGALLLLGDRLLSALGRRLRRRPQQAPEQAPEEAPPGPDLVEAGAGGVQGQQPAGVGR